MRNLFLAGAAALAMTVAPAAAQEADAPAGSVNSVNDKQSFNMNTDQQAVYDAMPLEQRGEFDRWDPDRQVMYFGWNDALRDYYWSLDADQRNAWWYLDDEQRISLFQLQDEKQRDLAWNSILTQVARVEQGRTPQAATTSTRAAPTNVSYASEPVVQSTPRATQPSEYPVCNSDADDSCINKWAAGQRGPGVERPLSYWPGHPASEDKGG